MTTYDNETVDPDVLSEEQEQELLRDAPWTRFAVIGDSIAAGLGDPVDGYAQLDWAARVARALRHGRPGLEYLNLGVRELRARRIRETQLERALAFSPDLVAVAAGGNNAISDTFEPEAVEAEVDLIVGTLREAGADVFMFGLIDIFAAFDLPEPWGSQLRERMATFRAITGDVALRHGAVLVDCTPHPRGADRSLYSADMLHLNMRGHAIVASEAVRELARVAAPAVRA